MLLRASADTLHTITSELNPNPPPGGYDACAEPARSFFVGLPKDSRQCVGGDVIPVRDGHLIADAYVPDPDEPNTENGQWHRVKLLKVHNKGIEAVIVRADGTTFKPEYPAIKSLRVSTFLVRISLPPLDLAQTIAKTLAGSPLSHQQQQQQQQQQPPPQQQQQNVPPPQQRHRPTPSVAAAAAKSSSDDESGGEEEHSEGDTTDDGDE